MKFSLKTREGCCRWLAVFLITILLGGFFARLIGTDFNSVKIEEFKIDARGATLNGEVFYPAGTTSEDSLPCVISIHGTGCTYGVVRHFAFEMARRGYVGIAISCYGGGLSEQPAYDELGHGIDINEGFKYGNSTSGMLDAVNYARSMEFVDKTRIGIAGHSMGGRITQCTAMADAGFYSYNDLMINVLYDTFGQTFTKEEINMDAAALAAERLTAEQLEYYNYLAEQTREYVDTRVKAAFPMGNGMQNISILETVTVGGHEVQRGCQINLGFLNGKFDFGKAELNTLDYAKEAWHTGSEDIAIDKWYEINDPAGKSTIIGDFGDSTIVNNEALSKAIENRSARVYTLSEETHSKNFFSVQTTAAFIEFFEQTLNYSNGNLTDGAVPMDSGNQLWHIARIFNLIALIGMVGLMFPLLALILQTKFFAPIVGSNVERNTPFNRKKYWIFALVGIAFTFLAGYIGNKHTSIISNDYLQLTQFFGAVFYFILIIGGLSLLTVIANALISKKSGGSYGIDALNINLGLINTLKSILLGFILIGAAYLSLMVLEYLFHEDYRFWMTIVTFMKVDYWWIAFKFALVFFVPYLAIGAAVNYGIRTDIPEWKDDLITVIVNSLGIWLLAAINILLCHLTDRTSLFSNFVVSYQLLLCVPITVYISRKMYRLTNSIWVGAVFNAMFVAWSSASELGAHSMYIGQNWLSIFFNV